MLEGTSCPRCLLHDNDNNSEENMPHVILKVKGQVRLSREKDTGFALSAGFISDVTRLTNTHPVSGMPLMKGNSHYSGSSATGFGEVRESEDHLRCHSPGPLFLLFEIGCLIDLELGQLG